MELLKLKILDAEGQTLMTAPGAEQVSLVYMNAYKPGDRVALEIGTPGQYIVIQFEDGSREVLQLTKTAAPQTFAITPRTAKSLKLFELKKAEDPSPFPALTQLEAWGTEAP